MFPKEAAVLSEEGKSIILTKIFILQNQTTNNIYRSFSIKNKTIYIVTYINDDSKLMFLKRSICTFGIKKINYFNKIIFITKLNYPPYNIYKL